MTGHEDHAFDKDYWEGQWREGEGLGSMTSNPPHPYLAHELAGLTPGTALDAGCGAGAEALWLAEAGWQVTAADISAEALAQAAAREVAAGGDHSIEWVEADLGVWQPPHQFDLVTTHYAHPAIPQLEFYDRLAGWVAPGGTLLIVGHLHTHGASHGHGDGHGHPPAGASATVDSITQRLDGALWEINSAQEVQRTMTGPGGHDMVLDDVVVRATRRRS